MTTAARPQASTPRKAHSKTKVLWYRILDSVQSLLNRTRKEIRCRKKWGAGWRNMERSGRRYTRVEFNPYRFSDDLTGWQPYQIQIRPEPGWEWNCQNCKDYSLIRESDMPAILSEWEATALKTIARGYKPGPKPTAATAGCPNCHFRPGAPE